MLVRFLYTAAFVLAGVSAAFASAEKVPVDAFRADSIDIVNTDNNLFVRMSLDLSAYRQLERNREVIITPVIVGGDDSLALPSVTVAGRSRYYYWLRQSSDRWPSATLRRASDAGVIDYNATVAYEKWMETSQLVINAESRGCCGTPVSAAGVTMSTIDFSEREAMMFMPQFVFIQPKAELEKHREIRGSAYIDFPVNRTELYPDYRRNPQELAKIRATIDSVRLDKDVTFKAMTIKGYASPEGPYDNNIRLAKGRTATLRDYVLWQYDFPSSVISTSYEPEDWEGLRRYVESSALPSREAILALIDSDMAPDPKNDALRARFPREYAFLLKEVYPGLRHSDYTVEYVVRNYTDIDEIKQVLFSAPQKLSLNEMFAAASTMEPGTPEYDEAYAIAVRMYPDSPEANLNAAIAALKTANFDAAAGYLRKAGDSPEAVYARGLYEAFTGNYAAARHLLGRALDSGIEPAADAIRQIDAIRSEETK